MVRPDVLIVNNRRIDAEVLLHGTQAAVLDRGAALDDEGDRGGPTLGRLPEGVSRERARCPRGIPPLKNPQWLSTFGRSGSEGEISPDLGTR